MRKLQTTKPGRRPKPTDCHEITSHFLSSPIDMERLMHDLEQSTRQHEFTSKAFAGWNSIPLRSLNGVTGKEGSNASGKHASACPDDFKDTVVMQPYIRELIDQISEGAGVLKVRLMRLEASRIIGEHKDSFRPAELKVARLHIPVITNDKVKFYVNGKCYHMDTGKLYRIDVSQFHRVRNDGAEDRVHLVFDVCMNDRIREKLNASLKCE